MKKQIVIFLTTILALSIVLVGCVATQESTEQNQKPLTSNPEESEKPMENTKFIFTANEGGSISKIDASTNEVVETIKVDGVVHNVQVSPDGKMLGVTVVPGGGHGDNSDNPAEEHSNHGSNEQSDEHSEGHSNQSSNDHSDDQSSHESSDHSNGYAMFYDIESGELLKQVTVGNHPAHIVFTSDSKLALVTNNGDNNVSVIDTNTFEITNTIQTGKGPHGFRISSDDKFAYIANMSDITVSVINLQTYEEDKKIEVGQAPVTSGISSDGKILVTSLNAENKVAIVDVETGEVEKVDVGKGPAQVYIQSDNKYVFVANQGTEENPSDSITKIDLTNNQVVATIKTGKGSHGVVTSSDNKLVYVTNMFDNTVSVIDNEKNEVIATIDVDKIPNGISVMP
ncbi:YncE family protein [Bacillus sp. PS06]|uniref:YncE family protein n=1 Tax=Bacillus sp. PS06 TaxID=2764176 RepID=UPI00177DC441|nr:YncE family protein [Bacillus sp. PS06]MBD8069280.1 YncE family protein [Bacillus sp. PS06]